MSKPILLTLLLSLPFSAALAMQPAPPTAQAIIDQYLQIALPDSGLYGPTRGERTNCLRQLTAMPEEAAPAVAAALASATRPVHRIELLEVLGRIPTRASADILVRYLHDPDQRIRSRVILNLRLLAARIDRSGFVNVPRAAQFAPKVEGLVPYLVEAAADSDRYNRELALFALADSRDSLAVKELHGRLKDPTPPVRFKAACLLTEFGDAAGLPELKQALQRLTDDQAPRDLLRYFDAEMLVASLQRITGESFGRIPPNPNLLSSTRDRDESIDALEALLKQWAAWSAGQQSAGDR